MRQLVKEMLYAAISGAGLHRRIRRRLGPGLVVLTYHSVGDRRLFPYLERLPLECFARQMKYLKSRFKVLDLQVGLDAVRVNACSEPCVAVTFDDGFGDVYTGAAPILRELGIPATVFVATDYLNTRRLPWPTQISAILHHRNADTLDLDGILTEQGLISLRERSEVLYAGNVLRSALSCMSPGDRYVILEELSRRLRVGRFEVIAPLDWAEVRAMRDWGIRTGSHTEHHSWLDKIQPQDLVRELEQSKACIENQTGYPCDIVAYPNGNYDDAVVSCGRSSGYSYGLTQAPGVNSFETWDPMRILRIDIPFNERFHTFKCRIHGATLR